MITSSTVLLISSTLFIGPEYKSWQSRHRPLVAGISISTTISDAKDDFTKGTICCFVKKKSMIYAMTAGHVVKQKSQDSFNTRIVQPALIVDNGNTKTDFIGTPEKNKTRLDIGLVKLRSGIHARNQVVCLGKITGVTDSVELGDKLHCVGRTNGVFKARVVSSERIKLSDADYVEKLTGVKRSDLYLIEKAKNPLTAEGGDSGGPVLTEDNKLVGMIVASYPPKKRYTLVIPIHIILEKTGCKFLE